MGFLCMVRGRPLAARVESIWDNGRPMVAPTEEWCHGVTERWQSRKKATPQTAEPPAPLKGSLKGRRCAVLYE